MKRTGKPEALEHGQAQVVIQDNNTDQRLHDLATIAGIQRGLRGMYAGTGQDAEDVFEALEHDLRMLLERDRMMEAHTPDLRADIAEGVEQARRGELIPGTEGRERIRLKSRERPK